MPGIPDTMPIHVEENGWPTCGRARLGRAGKRWPSLMVRAVHDYRGTYNVTDYRWFNLRDADSSSDVLFQHFGLLESDYRPKPAFGAYRELVRELG